MGHLTAHYLPNKVGKLKFCIADVCAKNRKNIGMRGSYIDFLTCNCNNLTI